MPAMSGLGEGEVVLSWDGEGEVVVVVAEVAEGVEVIGGIGADSSCATAGSAKLRLVTTGARQPPPWIRMSQ